MTLDEKREGPHASQDSASSRSGGEHKVDALSAIDWGKPHYTSPYDLARLSSAEALQEWFDDDPKAALECVAKTYDPALLPMLVDLLQYRAITHFHMAEALEQITDEPERTRAIEIKRSKEVQVESFPQRAVVSAADDDKIYEHLQTEELRKAFQINPWRASELIVEDAKSDPIARHIHASNLTPLLRDQGRVQLFMALALARIAEQPQQQSKAIEIAFAEAAQLGGDRETLCFALQCLEPFEDLIVDQLAADASDATWRRRDITLRFFVVLLGDAALDEQEQLTVAGIVLRCAGGGLDAVIRRMAELSNVTVEEMGLRVCGRVLARADQFDASERTEATGWIERHLSGEHAAIPTCAIASQSSAAPTSEGSVESPRAPIHPSLTDVPSNMQTSLVPHMDVSQGNSTAAPSPDLDLSSYQITRNGAGDGFSPTRSSTATTAVPDDGVDLASVSFTTEDPIVLRARTLLVSEPAEGLSRLDVFEHGRTLLRCIVHDSPSEEHVQLYLDRLHKTDFSKLSIPEKQMIARTVNRLVEAGELGLYLQKDESGEAGLNRVTKMSCYVPKRSKGSIQAREGNVTHYTGTTWPQLIVKSSLPARLDEEKFE